MNNNIRLSRVTRGVQRRVFLKALALGISLPVAVKLGRMATAGAPGAQKRMLVMFLPHGIPPEHYNPRVNSSDPTDFTLSDTNASILGPLEAYKEYVNVYEGFQYMGDASTHEGIVNCLSGVTTADDTSSRTTVEHVIGQELGIRPLILGACAHQPYGIDRNAKLFWNGSAIDPEKDPSKVADDLFGGVGAAAAPSDEPNPEVALRNELLQLTAAEISQLQADVSGLTHEQTKLQTHLESIQNLRAASEGTGSAPQVSCTARPNLPTVERVRSASAGQVIDSSGGNDYFYQERNFPLIYEAQLELAAQALICNAAPIIGVQGMYTTCDFDFGFAGAPGSHHNGLSHMTAQQAAGAQWDSPVSVDNYNASAREPFAKAQLWFANQLVDKIISVLAATDDPTAPGTTVLDNTLIYWMSEIGDGANHLRVSGIEYPQVPTNLPLVTIGKAAGALHTGRVFSNPLANVEDKQARPATDIYLTLARAMGASSASFPGTTGVLEGALT
jgi:hypothetical protein